MKKIAVATVIALGALSSAQAQYYGELGYLTSTYKESAENYKSKPNAIRLIGGYNIMENLAVEGMIAFGTNNAKDKTDSGLTGDVTKIKNMVGLYIKPNVDVSSNVNLFARIGYARTSYTGTDGDDPWKANISKLSYGIGASYAITPKISLNGDYMHYFKKEGVTSRGFTVGMGYKF